MLLRRIATVIFFIGLIFFFFRQEAQVIEGTTEGVNYHIEIEDSQTLFYFQCPSYSWEIGGDVPTVWINGFDYDPVYEDEWCPPWLTWEIATDSGERILLTTTTRQVMVLQVQGLAMMLIFLWLLVGCFHHVQQFDRLAMFTLLWGFTYVLHLISYEYYRTTFNFLNWTSLLPILALVLLLANPRSIVPLILLASAQLIEYLVISPYSSNHTLTIATVNVLILLSLLIHLLKNGRIHINRNEFYETFAPALRVIVLLLYFWAWFHKLNSGFVNVEHSCVVGFYKVLRFRFLEYGLPVVPRINDTISTTLIYLTFIVEGGLPLLLLFKRTRLIAILVGIGFHGVLGLITFRDFSGLMFNLYFVFLSLEAMEHIQSLRPKFFEYIPGWLKQLLWSLVILMLVLSLPGMRFAQDHINNGLLAIGIYTVLAGIVTLYLLYQQWIVADSPDDTDLFAPVFNPQSALMWLVIAFMIINGAMPYIGLKTNNSYDMYSNLRVEGHSNHFLPIRGHIFNYPDDLVQIVSASDYFYYSEDSDYVFLAFREMVYEQQPAYVMFIRDGEEIRVDRGNYEAVLGSRLPLIARKFMIFEPVYRGDIYPCSH